MGASTLCRDNERWSGQANASVCAGGLRAKVRLASAKPNHRGGSAGGKRGPGNGTGSRERGNPAGRRGRSARNAASPSSACSGTGRRRGQSRHVDRLLIFQARERTCRLRDFLAGPAGEGRRAMKEGEEAAMSPLNPCTRRRPPRRRGRPCQLPRRLRRHARPVSASIVCPRTCSLRSAAAVAARSR